MKAKRILLVGVAVAVLALGWSSAEAGGVRFGIGINVPMGGPVYYPRYYYPPPYYYPYPYYGAPVYAQPAPVYVQPPAVYAQPSPVYAQPVYAQPTPAYAQPAPAAQQYYIPPGSQTLTPATAVPPAPQPNAPPSATLPGIAPPPR